MHLNFYNIIFVMPCMVGVVFIAVGFIIFKIFPPEKINSLYGYRTSNSMESQERWGFTQTYSSKLMIYCGFFLLLFSTLGLCIELDANYEAISSGFMIILSVAFLLISTENALKKAFKDEV